VPSGPVTQKTRRKAAAATANDYKVFQETKFGRARIRSFPVRLVRGVISLVRVPLAFVYRSTRRPERPVRTSD
jgi:hypothetical protein